MSIFEIGFCADRCRDNSCTCVSRNDCAGFLKTILLVLLEMTVLVFLEMILVFVTLETNPVLTMTLETNPLCILILETICILK